jgi:predicted ATPase
MAIELKSLTIKGYKTYRELQNFEPNRISVLVGANGAGKSNLISFFSLLYRMMANPGELQLAVSEAGGANRLLHDGVKKTESIFARLEFQTDETFNFYDFRLQYAANDTLIFGGESWGLYRSGTSVYLGGGITGGNRESSLQSRAYQDQLANSLLLLLRKFVSYQFHDTSFTAGMRRKSSRSDGQYLHRDGSNIAAYLYRLGKGTETEYQAYQGIQESVRRLIPFFAEFVLEPENGHVLLQWRERGSEEIFSASQASDGMLRIFALMTLLCQPKENLPALMMLDEPELGLHPQAIMLLGAHIRKVSQNCQVIVATQSTALVDEFSLDEIVVLSRPGRESTLRRLNEQEYAAWLEEYSAGELWRKNIFEGGPGR